MRVETIAQLAAAIRARRGLLNLTQAQLAERAGVSRLWVGRIEAGAATAEIGRLMRVLRALELDLRIEPAGVPAPTPNPSGDIDLDELLAGYEGPPR
jgi:HTH-type transcriptional regulator/antitoxin HipB